MFQEIIESSKLYYLQDGVRTPYDCHVHMYDPLTELLWMFCYKSDQSPWLKHKSLRIQLHMNRPGGGYPQAEIKAYWLKHVQVMQAFIFNGMATTRFVTSEIQGYDDIVVHQYLHADSIRDIEKIWSFLGFTKASIREVTKSDILEFGFDRYSNEGSRETFSLPEIVGNACRIQVSDEHIASCAEDLVAEGVLVQVTAQGFKIAPSVATNFPEYQVRRAPKLPKFFQEVNTLHARIDTMIKAAQDQPNTDTNKIFIIHGHDEAKRRELKEILETRFNLTPVVMQDQPGQSRTFIEKFEAVAGPCGAAIAILTPDDAVDGEDTRYKQPRPNVLFELGWFMGRLARNRVLLVVKDGTNIPNDLLGIEQIRFQNNIVEAFVKIEGEITQWKGALRTA